jgi:hypothetical protein
VTKLSVVIPSRDEQFLIPTIDDIFRNAQGEIEVVAVLDSNQWPAGWKEVTERHANLHTIHHGEPRGMRSAINSGYASAMSRGAGYVMKLDGHCSLSEGFDVTLLSEIDDDWVVVPRRGRLDPENWRATETHKPDIDYHYLSFPDDPNDWGGAGLNGKPWDARAKERADVLLDEEMSSQGSCWLMHVDYFQRLELMDDVSYGPFWSEFQEVGLKCWLSGGRVMVNKKARYLHLHKGKKYGRGYRLQESALTTGRNHTMKWIWNEAWDKQTLPFSWLIEHFWPVPTWPEDWEAKLYAERKPRVVPVTALSVESASEAKMVADREMRSLSEPPEALSDNVKADDYAQGSLLILAAVYGIDGHDLDGNLDVALRVQSLVKDNSLDIIVNNSTLCPGQNPHRGKKKKLTVLYHYVGSEPVQVERDEKDWLIIGQARPNGEQTPIWKPRDEPETATIDFKAFTLLESESGIRREAARIPSAPMSATALNDYLIRKFSISPQRLKAPMPIELPNFHRNDLAQLFAELGFKRGAEIGVAEGNYSQVLLKANPECELLLVDPWHAYSENPQNKTEDKHTFAYTEALRKTKNYKVMVMQDYSMNAVRELKDDSLDFAYIDGNHLFDYVMQDLIEWSKRVRSGGIVSGDDYYALDQKRWVGGGVVEAVQAYVNAHRISPWFIFAGHKSTDFFWVRP